MHYSTTLLNGEIDKKCTHFLVLIPTEKVQKTVDFFLHSGYNHRCRKEIKQQKASKVSGSQPAQRAP